MVKERVVGGGYIVKEMRGSSCTPSSPPLTLSQPHAEPMDQEVCALARLLLVLSGTQRSHRRPVGASECGEARRALVWLLLCTVLTRRVVNRDASDTASLPAEHTCGGCRSSCKTAPTAATVPSSR